MVKSPDGYIDSKAIAPIIDDDAEMMEKFPTVMEWIFANRVYVHVSATVKKDKKPRTTYDYMGAECEMDAEALELAKRMGWYNY